MAFKKLESRVTEKPLTRRKALKGILGYLGAGIMGTLAGRDSDAYSQYPNPRVMVPYDADHVISADYRNRELDWENSIKSKTPVKPVTQGATNNGHTQISNQGGGVSVVGGGAQPDYDAESKLSADYNLSDFIKSYDKLKWDHCLSQEEKQRTSELIARMGLKQRETLCNVYSDTYGFYNANFTDQEKKAFYKFNNAYKYLVKTKKSANPSLELFNIDELEKALGKSYPWIRLRDNKMPLNVADRLLVFRAINKSGKKLINWNKVTEYDKETSIF